MINKTNNNHFFCSTVGVSWVSDLLSLISGCILFININSAQNLIWHSVPINSVRDMLNCKFIFLFKFFKNSSIFRATALTESFISDSFYNSGCRFFLIHSLSSETFNNRMFLSSPIRHKTAYNSIHSVFYASNWLDRESSDMFGIQIKNHPNLSNILTDYGFVGNPLLKDFPVTGLYTINFTPSKQNFLFQKSLNKLVLN